MVSRRNIIGLVVLLVVIAIAMLIFWERSALQKDLHVNTPFPSHRISNRCNRLHYDGPNEDPRCYALYEKLVKSASEDDIIGIQEALNAGAQIEGTIDGSYTPLVTAAMGGKLEALRFLLDRGAAIDYQSGSWKKSAISVAAFYGHDDVIAELIQRGANVCVAELDEPPAFPFNIAILAGNYKTAWRLAYAGGSNCK